jgi:hypothetical protein
MCSGDDLDALGESSVTGDFAVVVAVSAYQLGEHLRVTRIGLRTRQGVPIPIPRRCFRVDRIHDVAGVDKGLHPQAPIRLDPDDHLAGITGMTRDEVMESRHPLDALRQSFRRQPRAASSHK